MNSSLESLFQLGPGGKLGNRYRLDHCLGDGTYGFVWKAERLDDNEIVAIKIPKSQGGRDSDLEEGRALKDAEPHLPFFLTISMTNNKNIKVRPNSVLIIPT